MIVIPQHNIGYAVVYDTGVMGLVRLIRER